MNRRSYCRLPTHCIGLIIALFVAMIRTAPAADEQPNIIIVMADDMGYSDLGCYGGEIQTGR